MMRWCTPIFILFSVFMTGSCKTKKHDQQQNANSDNLISAAEKNDQDKQLDPLSLSSAEAYLSEYHIGPHIFPYVRVKATTPPAFYQLDLCSKEHSTSCTSEQLAFASHVFVGLEAGSYQLKVRSCLKPEQTSAKDPCGGGSTVNLEQKALTKDSVYEKILQAKNISEQIKEKSKDIYAALFNYKSKSYQNNPDTAFDIKIEQQIALGSIITKEIINSDKYPEIYTSIADPALTLSSDVEKMKDQLSDLEKNQKGVMDGALGQTLVTLGVLTVVGASATAIVSHNTPKQFEKISDAALLQAKKGLIRALSSLGESADESEDIDSLLQKLEKKTEKNLQAMVIQSLEKMGQKVDPNKSLDELILEVKKIGNNKTGELQIEYNKKIAELEESINKNLENILQNIDQGQETFRIFFAKETPTTSVQNIFNLIRVNIVHRATGKAVKMDQNILLKGFTLAEAESDKDYKIYKKEQLSYAYIVDESTPTKRIYKVKSEPLTESDIAPLRYAQKDVGGKKYVVFNEWIGSAEGSFYEKDISIFPIRKMQATDNISEMNFIRSEIENLDFSLHNDFEKLANGNYRIKRERLPQYTHVDGTLMRRTLPSLTSKFPDLSDETIARLIERQRLLWEGGEKASAIKAEFQIADNDWEKQMFKGVVLIDRDKRLVEPPELWKVEGKNWLKGNATGLTQNLMATLLRQAPQAKILTIATKDAIELGKETTFTDADSTLLNTEGRMELGQIARFTLGNQVDFTIWSTEIQLRLAQSTIEDYAKATEEYALAKNKGFSEGMDALKARIEILKPQAASAKKRLHEILFTDLKNKFNTSMDWLAENEKTLADNIKKQRAQLQAEKRVKDINTTIADKSRRIRNISIGIAGVGVALIGAVALSQELALTDSPQQMLIDTLTKIEADLIRLHKERLSILISIKKELGQDMAYSETNDGWIYQL